MNGPDYRTWLQDRYHNSSDPIIRQQASALLGVVGNDGKLDANFVQASNNQATTGRYVNGQYQGYGADGMTRINEQMLGAYSAPNRQYEAIQGLSWTGGSGGGGGGGGGVSNPYDPAALAFYDDQMAKIDGSLGRLDNQRNVGRQNIENSVNDGINSLNDQYGRAQRNYETNRQSTINDNLSGKQQIDTSVRQNTRGMQSRLGMSGAGNSSAASILAPWAAAREGSKQRQTLQNAYAKNLRGMDTQWEDTTADWKNQKDNLERERQNRLNSLDQDIEGNRAKLLENRASMSAQKAQAQGKGYAQVLAESSRYNNEVNGILDRIDSLGAQYKGPVAIKDVNYKAPTLDSYDTKNAKLGDSTVPGADQLDPNYAQLLEQRKKDEENRLFNYLTV